MSDMEKVETTIGKDDPFRFCLEVFHNPPKRFSCLDLFLHRHPLTKTYQI
jgi:hypothetical protein